MLTINIDGMTCSSCVETIQTALKGLVDNDDFTINLESGTAHFEADIDLSEVLLAINESGYKATLRDKNEYKKVQVKKDNFFYDLVPLYIILSYVLIGSLGLNREGFTLSGFMTDFMGLFYVVFSLFKFIDYRNFPGAFSKYDPIAKIFVGYGWIYPFIEVCLGINFLLKQYILFTLVATIIILGATTLGVLNNLIQKRSVQCACMGTAIKLPLTKATLVENFIMLGMASWMLLTILLSW